jgi:hypothetical protein
VPKKSKPVKQRPLYKQKPPKPKGGRPQGPVLPRRPNKKADQHVSPTTENNIGRPIPAAPFQLREDGSIVPAAPLPVGEGIVNPARRKSEAVSIRQTTAKISPSPGEEDRGEGGHDGRKQGLPKLIFSSDTPFVRLYHGNCLELLDAIAAKYPEGRFDAIFADAPYFLSNGGITLSRRQDGPGG